MTTVQSWFITQELSQLVYVRHGIITGLDIVRKNWHYRKGNNIKTFTVSWLLLCNQIFLVLVIQVTLQNELQLEQCCVVVNVIYFLRPTTSASFLHNSKFGNGFSTLVTARWSKSQSGTKPTEIMFLGFSSFFYNRHFRTRYLHLSLCPCSIQWFDVVFGKHKQLWIGWDMVREENVPRSNVNIRRSPKSLNSFAKDCKLQRLGVLVQPRLRVHHYFGIKSFVIVLN